MGYLGVAEGMPALLFSLVIGVWVDRWRRRPVLVAADLGRAALMGLIPATALLGVLRMEGLYVIAFAAGTLSLFFDVAVTSFLPTVVQRAWLIDANGKLQMSSSVTSVGGRALGGVLVQALTAPVAIAADALSFLASALLIGRVRAQEPGPEARRERKDVRGEIGEGLRFLIGEPLLRSMTLSSAIGSLALSAQATVLVLYATRALGVTPALLGAVFAIRSVASVAGAALSGRVGRRLGAGRAVIWGTLMGALGAMTLPLAGGPLALAVLLLIAAQVLAGIGAPIYSVNQVSLRQEITPDRMLGRVNAGRRFLVFGAAPVGAFLGGLSGSELGLRTTLLLGGVGMALAFVVVLLSPLRHRADTDARALPGT